MDRRNIIGIVAVFVLVILSTVVFGSNRRFLIGDEPDIVGDEETTCCVYTLDNRDANCFPSSIADCTILDGVISGPGCDEDPIVEDHGEVYTTDDITHVNVDDPVVQQLLEDADKSNIGKGGGINEYIAGVYECKDFANDLEKYLEGVKNADGTKRYSKVTYSSIRFWDENGKYLPKRNHAVVDVHTPDGKIFFIDPQLAEKGVKMIYNADFNKDGTVSVHVRQKIILRNAQNVITERNVGKEGGFRAIWIYDSLQDKNNIHATSTTSTTTTSSTSSTTSILGSPSISTSITSSTSTVNSGFIE